MAHLSVLFWSLATRSRTLVVYMSYAYVLRIATHVATDTSICKYTPSLKVVPNSLNPVWEGTPGSGGEALHLGVHETGALLTVTFAHHLSRVSSRAVRVFLYLILSIRHSSSVTYAHTRASVLLLFKIWS